MKPRARVIVQPTLRPLGILSFPINNYYLKLTEKDLNKHREIYRDMKRSQLSTGQIAFLFALVIIFLLIFFGTKFIGNIIDKTRTAELKKFKEELSSEFTSMAYGKEKEIKLKLPSEVTQLCFFDKFNNASGKPADSTDPVLMEYASQSENVFLFKNNIIVSHFKVKGLRLANKSVKCWVTRGWLTLKLKGEELGTTFVS